MTSTATATAERAAEERERRRAAQDGMTVPVVTLGVRRVHIPAAGAVMSGALHSAAGVTDAIRDRLPDRRHVLYYGGLGAMAAFGVLSWPAVAAIGAGVWVAERARGGFRRAETAGAKAGETAEATEQAGERAAGIAMAKARAADTAMAKARAAETGTAEAEVPDTATAGARAAEAAAAGARAAEAATAGAQEGSAQAAAEEGEEMRDAMFGGQATPRREPLP